MPTVQVQFGKPYHSLDPSQARRNITYDLINGTVDVDGSFVKREGYSLFSSGISVTAGAVYSMYKDANDNIFACSNPGLLYLVGPSGGVTAVTSTASNYWYNIPRWCEDRSNPFVVNGQNILKVNTSGKSFSPLTANAPSGVSFIAFQDQYLLCDGLLPGGVVGDTNYSDDRTNGYSATSSWECYNNEYGPDGLTLVWSKWSEVYNGGPRTIETTYDSGDANNPWARAQVPVMTCGVLAPYSWVEFEDTFIWLATIDGKPAIVQLVGREPKEISGPWSSSIPSTAGTPNSIGFRLNGGTGGRFQFYVVTLSTSITLAYNRLTGTWSQWSLYSGGVHDRLAVVSSLSVPIWGKQLVGVYTDQSIHSWGGYTDAGTPIRFELTSGGIDHSTWRKKFCRGLNFRWKSGNTTNVFRYSHRDDGGSWSTEQTIGPNAKTADGVYYTSISNVGKYRSREHKIVHDATDSDFIFVGLEETFDVGAY